jgi:hypothetical protein
MVTAAVPVAVTLAEEMRDGFNPCRTGADESRFDVPVETGKLVSKIVELSRYLPDTDTAA